MESSQQSGYSISVNGINPHTYELSKQMWNTVYGFPTESIAFLDFCASHWEQMKPLNNLAVQHDVPELFANVYRYYRDMAFVGAQAELERVRGTLIASNPRDVWTLMHLRGMRMNISSDYGPGPLVPDTAEEYYRQTTETANEQDTDSSET